MRQQILIMVHRVDNCIKSSVINKLAITQDSERGTATARETTKVSQTFVVSLDVRKSYNNQKRYIAQNVMLV